MREAEADLQRAWRQAERPADGQTDWAQGDAVLLMDATLRWNVVAMRLDDVSADAARPVLVAQEVRASLSCLADALLPARRSTGSRPPVRHHASVVVFLRRSVIVAFSVEVARKICRGRAPPVDFTARSL